MSSAAAAEARPSITVGGTQNLQDALDAQLTNRRSPWGHATTPVKEGQPPMATTVRKTAITVAALAAFGLGGAAIAGAADSNSTSTATQQRPQRQLSSDVAAKVKAAALAKVPGATVLRTEAG